MKKLHRFLRRAGKTTALEQQLDVALAARALARRRHELGREPIRQKARQLCSELGRPVPAALEARA